MEKVITDIKIDIKFDEPKNYSLIMWNDDTTSFEIVIEALCCAGLPRQKSIESAIKAHTEGKCCLGIFSYEIAKAMRDNAVNYARARGAVDFSITIEEE